MLSLVRDGYKASGLGDCTAFALARRTAGLALTMFIVCSSFANPAIAQTTQENEDVTTEASPRRPTGADADLAALLILSAKSGASIVFPFLVLAPVVVASTAMTFSPFGYSGLLNGVRLSVMSGPFLAAPIFICALPFAALPYVLFRASFPWLTREPRSGSPWFFNLVDGLLHTLAIGAWLAGWNAVLLGALWYATWLGFLGRSLDIVLPGTPDRARMASSIWCGAMWGFGLGGLVAFLSLVPLLACANFSSVPAAALFWRVVDRRRPVAAADAAGPSEDVELDASPEG